MIKALWSTSDKKEIDGILKTKKLSPGAAGKLKGKVYFMYIHSRRANLK